MCAYMACPLRCAGETEEDGYEDEYQLNDVDVSKLVMPLAFL